MELTFFFPHVSRTQHLTLASTRTRVIQLRAQCTDHWTTGQSRGVGMPTVQLTTHVKSSTLYGCTVVWLCGRTVVRSYSRTVVLSYIQIFLAQWVPTILYNYGAKLCIWKCFSQARAAMDRFFPP